MEKEFEKKLESNRNILRGIGVLEIVGGITGIGLILWLILQGTETVVPILLIATGFYIYSIFAGITLFINKEQGILHSQVLQFLQLIAVSFGGVTYQLTSGGKFFVGYNMTESKIELSISILASEFRLDALGSDQSNFFFINMMAIVILYLLDNSHKTIQLQKTRLANYEANMNKFKERKISPTRK